MYYWEENFYIHHHLLEPVSETATVLEFIQHFYAPPPLGDGGGGGGGDGGGGGV